MIERLALTATIGTGLVIGLLWPRGDQSVEPQSSSPTEVTIARSSDHHFYADANVNGRSVHFMIDTGASETALTEADARRIGVAVDPTKYQVLGDGASGMVRGQYIHLTSIEFNGIRQHDIRVVVVPGATVSLLGQSFLETVDEIVIRKSEMRLKVEGRA